MQLNEVRLNKVVKAEAKPDTLSCQFERARKEKEGGKGRKKKRNYTGDARGRARVYAGSQGLAIIIYHL